MVHPLQNTVWQFLKQLNTILPWVPTIQLLEILPPQKKCFKKSCMLLCFVEQTIWNMTWVPTVGLCCPCDLAYGMARGHTVGPDYCVLWILLEKKKTKTPYSGILDSASAYKKLRCCYFCPYNMKKLDKLKINDFF